MAVFLNAGTRKAPTSGWRRFRVLATSALCGAAIAGGPATVAFADTDLSPSFTSKSDSKAFITIVIPTVDPGSLTLNMKAGDDTAKFGISDSKLMVQEFGTTATINGGAGVDTFRNTEFSDIIVGGKTTLVNVETFKNSGVFEANGGFDFLGSDSSETLTYGGNSTLEVSGGNFAVRTGAGNDTFMTEAGSAIEVDGSNAVFNGNGGTNVLDNAGSVITLNGGDILVSNFQTFKNDGVLRATSGDFIYEGTNGADDFSNDGNLTAGGSGLFDGAGGNDTFSNTGTMNFGDNGTLITNFEAVENSGTISVNRSGSVVGGNALTINGDLTNGGTLDMQQDRVGDVIDVNGIFTSVAGSTVSLDTNIGSDNPGSDVLTAERIEGGDLRLAMTVHQRGGLDLLDNPITVVSTNGPGFDATIQFNGAGGFSDLGDGQSVNISSLTNISGLVDYVVQNDGGDIIIDSVLNGDKAGGVAQGFASTLSSISAIFQKPISALVSRCKASDTDGTGFGTWVRAAGGELTTTAQGEAVSEAGTVSSLSTKNETDYAGLQGGLDTALCNQAGGNTYHFGLLFGTVSGTSQQVDIAQALTADFNTRFVGAYATLINDGGLAADATVRYDYHTFNLSHTDPSVVPDDAVNGATLSGALGVGYTIQLADRFFIRPSAGILVGSTSIDSYDAVSVTNYRYNDQLSIMGSASMTAQTIFDLTDTSSLLAFVNASLFNEFGDDPSASFRIGTTDFESNMSGIGTFGQIGAGVTLIAPGGSPVASPDLLGTLRFDAQIGDKIEGWGITAQARLQF